MKTLFLPRGLSFLTISHTANITICTVAVFPFETGISIQKARYVISFLISDLLTPFLGISKLRFIYRSQKMS